MSLNNDKNCDEQHDTEMLANRPWRMQMTEGKKIQQKDTMFTSDRQRDNPD